MLTAPRKATGDISVRYIGDIPALIPALTPMKNRPAISISKDSAYFEPSIKSPPKSMRILFRSKPPFLQLIYSIK